MSVDGGESLGLPRDGGQRNNARVPGQVSAEPQFLFVNSAGSGQLEVVWAIVCGGEGIQAKGTVLKGLLGGVRGRSGSPPTRPLSKPVFLWWTVRGEVRGGVRWSFSQVGGWGSPLRSVQVASRGGRGTLPGLYPSYHGLLSHGALWVLSDLVSRG